MAVDLHSALNNIPKSLNIVTTRHDRPYSNNGNSGYAGSQSYHELQRNK
jgi:hypothetical protein